MAGQGQNQRVYVLPLEKGGGRPVYRAWVTNPGQDPNGVIIQVETDRPSRLVLAETCYPGWQAEVDGVAQPVSPAQGIFRSVVLDPGDHVVSFSYKPATFVVGTFLGLLGAAVVGIVIGTALARRKAG